MFKPAALTLTICFLGLATALHIAPVLNPIFKKNSFFADSHDHFSYELYQTRNGIIAFSIETVNNTNTSQYLLIDIPARNSKPILKDIANACELVTPTFQPIHYHVQTDSLVYFCHANNSILIIDQSTYSVEKIIPLNISDSWPIVRISTDGMSIAVLLIDTMFTTTAKASMLVKVDLQVRQVTAKILLNKSLMVGETVVAYASNKKAAYVATNRISTFLKNLYITTTAYSILTIGSDYQLIPVMTVDTPLTSVKIVTKLFCAGGYVIVNNGTDLAFKNDYVIDPQRGPQVLSKSITPDQQGLFHLAVTSQYGSNDLYVQITAGNVFQYTFLDQIHFKPLGTYGDIQIAYGNQTSGDLMFATSSTTFSVIDLDTLKPMYTGPKFF